MTYATSSAGRWPNASPWIGSAWGWTVASALAAVVVLLPILSVAWIALSGTESIWPHLTSTVLPRALWCTSVLLVGTAALTLITGTLTAWIVTMFRFPGREIADRMLVLPLAIPVYIVSYAYVELLDYAGPVQTLLRSVLDVTSPAGYWFPEIRSLSGAVAIFSLTLYPYVYLSARASFIQQSVCVLEVARTLGQTASGAFWSIALPLARPALVAGVALVMMECLNDLGAVQYLGVETLSASIFATWTQRSNLPGAAQLALVMLGFVIALLLTERAARGGGAVHATTGRYRAIPFETLTGWRASVALAAVLFPVVVGFLVPFLVLLVHAASHLRDLDTASFAASARNSLVLASVVSCAAVLVALAIGYAVRLHGSPSTLVSARVASLGYALPGTVLAIGLLGPLAAFDNTIDAWMRVHAGVSTGLLLSGTLVAVSLALVIRFLAVALGAVEAGLERISPNVDAAAKTLGANSWTGLRGVHLPMLKPAVGAAALLVFVDAMKELPATLLLRPFNFETLATRVYGLTAAEQFEEAAVCAAAIVVIGLIPVLLLHRTIAGGRSGGAG